MNIPNVIADTDLSNAWIRTLSCIADGSRTEISPLVITLEQFGESAAIRDELNADLSRHHLDSVETVSETIFPQSLYMYCQKNRTVLYEKYIRSLPRIKKIDHRNSKGTYFERLIAFGDAEKVNQLEIIISSLHQDSTVKRRSKLQASVFDPLKDHTKGMFQGFPCLQHVTFYKSESGGLILNSFYAIQYLYQRAYGNWLGLVNLGKFIAHESGLEFERMNCFIGVEKLDKITKTQARQLLERLEVQNLVNRSVQQVEFA